MIWRIPVTWQMYGFQEIEADRLEDAMSKACNDFDVVDGEFVDGSLELDCEEVETIRSVYNYNMPDGADTDYPELKKYDHYERTRVIRWNDDGSEDAASRENRMNQGMGFYEIVFDVFGIRHYCKVEALSLSEALGVFFINNPHITYAMIVDHVEV